jgi:phosphoserine phosphatase RsbU/P
VDHAATDSRRLLGDLQIILDVARSLGAERDLDRLLHGIVAAVSQLLGSERTSCFLLGPDRTDLWTTVAEGAGTTIRLPLGRGIAGTVAATGVGITIPSAYDDPRFDPEHDRRSGFRTRSILCQPMRDHGGAVIGVIQTLNKRDGQPFGAYDAQVLEALCAQAAVAIVNAQLLARDLERQRLARDMELARQIQRSLLPAQIAPAAGWTWAAWSQTCDETGGDYYDVLPADDACDAVVGDVSGHGLGAALFMGTARASLRALHRRGGHAPGSLLAGLNELLQGDLGDDRFMTMGICRLGADGRAVYASAGHEPPLLLDPAGRWRSTEESGLILGMLPDQTYISTDLGILPPGAVVVLASDGIADAHRPGDAGGFGNDRLRRAIAQGATAPLVERADAVRAAVIDAVTAHLAGHAPHDDMTLLVAVRTGAAP